MEKIISNWLAQAKDDWEKAQILLDNNKLDGAAFYSQQTAEKALKALYIKKYKEIKKTHDLLFIAQQINAPPEILEYCEKLTLIFAETRYPDASDTIPAKKFQKEIIQEYLTLSKKILQWCKQNL